MVSSKEKEAAFIELADACSELDSAAVHLREGEEELENLRRAVQWRHAEVTSATARFDAALAAYTALVPGHRTPRP
jgi:hypothetical protein